MPEVEQKAERVKNPIKSAIRDAERISDPLDLLVEAAKNDPETAYSPEALDELSALKKLDPVRFERIRRHLKRAGVRVAELERAIAARRMSSSKKIRQPTDVFVDLLNDAELFHTSDGTAYADVNIGGNRHTLSVMGDGFRRWLTHRYYEECDAAATTETLKSAVGFADAKAQVDGLEREVFLRTAHLAGRYYLDLADKEYRVVEIHEGGWHIVQRPQVRFRRSPGMLSLPVPVDGGSIEQLMPFLNLRRETDFVLVVSWLLAALREHTSYPVLAISGEQGAAKSTFSKMLRSLVDPSVSPVRALPQSDRDLQIGADNSHVLAYDNVSALPHSISDALCRMATGAGFALRKLYSDRQETLFAASRPLILNGINNAVVRADLADRAISLVLEAIPASRRRTDTEIWKEFEEARCQILGALMSGMVMGLQEMPHVRLHSPPRMADLAYWATACEKAYWPAGTFQDAYRANRKEASAQVLEADTVALAVRNLMTDRAGWTGTASELLSKLEADLDDRIRKSKSWPSVPNQLSRRLNRAAPVLREMGITLEHTLDGHARTRLIVISNTAKVSEDSPSASSASLKVSTSEDPRQSSTSGG